MNKVTIELTIEKSDWVNNSDLESKIAHELEWPLATGGCKLLNIKAKTDNDKLDKFVEYLRRNP